MGRVMMAVAVAGFLLGSVVSAEAAVLVTTEKIPSDQGDNTTDFSSPLIWDIREGDGPGSDADYQDSLTAWGYNISDEAAHFDVVSGTNNGEAAWNVGDNGHIGWNSDDSGQAVFNGDGNPLKIRMEFTSDQDLINITKIETFSWHNGDRTVQNYSVYGYIGAANDNMDNHTADLSDTDYWTLIASVNTTALGNNGKTGSAITPDGQIAGKGYILGSYRGLVFSTTGGTFYQEFGVFTPEPATLALMGLGAVGMLLNRRKKR